MVLTQEIIDDAVLKVKGMQSKLAWELVKEEEFGGDISCCMTRLKLLWLWKNAIACKVLEVSSEATVKVIWSGPSHITSIHVYVNGEDISGLVTSSSTSATAWMQLITTSINAFQTTYKAIYDSTNAIITLYAKSGKELLVTTHSTWPGLTFETTDFTGYVEASGCISDEQTKALIGKINTMCN